MAKAMYEYSDGPEVWSGRFWFEAEDDDAAEQIAATLVAEDDWYGKPFDRSKLSKTSRVLAQTLKGDGNQWSDEEG